MQNLYISIRYLLIGYILCGLGWLLEDAIQPAYPALASYFKAAYIACYVLMMHFVTVAIFSVKQKSKTLRMAGWLIVAAMILAIWSMIPTSEKTKDLLYNISGLFSFMSGYYIVVEYSKIIEKSALLKAKKLARLIRKGVAFADIFFILLLLPIALSAFPDVTNALVNVDMYIYYVIWICFVVFLILCIMEIKRDLTQQITEPSIVRGTNP